MEIIKDKQTITLNLPFQQTKNMLIRINNAMLFILLLQLLRITLKEKLKNNNNKKGGSQIKLRCKSHHTYVTNA